MKSIAFITDLHFGCRGANEHFDDVMIEFLKKQVFPGLKKQKITDLICLGDFTDNRKQINFKTLHTIKTKFIPLLKEYKITFHIFDGNHDIFYKDSNEISSSLIFDDCENVIIYKEPTEVLFGDLKLLLVPWLNNNNFGLFNEMIQESSAEVCVGHFEFNGAKMYKKSTSISGLAPSLFSHFDSVLVGHFHHKNKLKNIQYIGAAGYYTWQDFDDYRGFCIMDIETKKIKYTKNKYSLFVELTYNDDSFEQLMEEIKTLKNKVVKVIVETKENIVNYESFIKEMYKLKLVDFTVEDKTIVETIYKQMKEEGYLDVDVEPGKSDVLELIQNELSEKIEFQEMEEIYSEAINEEDL